MEANVMAQATVASAVVPTPRQVDRAQTVTSTTRVAAPAPQVRSVSAPPAPSIADIAEAMSSVNILNAHPRVSFGSTENLVTSDFTTPVSDSDVPDTALYRYMDNVNEMLEPSFTRLSLFVHEATNRVQVEVIDTSTNEVIREIPPESRLDALARMKEMVGLLFDVSN